MTNNRLILSLILLLVICAIPKPTLACGDCNEIFKVWYNFREESSVDELSSWMKEHQQNNLSDFVEVSDTGEITAKEIVKAKGGAHIFLFLAGASARYCQGKTTVEKKNYVASYKVSDLSEFNRETGLSQTTKHSLSTGTANEIALRGYMACLASKEGRNFIWTLPTYQNGSQQTFHVQYRAVRSWDPDSVSISGISNCASPTSFPIVLNNGQAQSIVIDRPTNQRFSTIINFNTVGGKHGTETLELPEIIMYARVEANNGEWQHSHVIVAPGRTVYITPNAEQKWSDGVKSFTASGDGSSSKPDLRFSGADGALLCKLASDSDTSVKSIPAGSTTIVKNNSSSDQEVLFIMNDGDIWIKPPHEVDSSRPHTGYLNNFGHIGVDLVLGN